uniref:Uncharacterized protein n=1 Tax=Glossina palpalis gambiensis TaxID=67801 RepID=A0A1B0AQS1_9MUSC
MHDIKIKKENLNNKAEIKYNTKSIQMSSSFSQYQCGDNNTVTHEPKNVVKFCQSRNCSRCRWARGCVEIDLKSYSGQIYLINLLKSHAQRERNQQVHSSIMNYYTFFYFDVSLICVVKQGFYL